MRHLLRLKHGNGFIFSCRITTCALNGEVAQNSRWISQGDEDLITTVGTLCEERRLSEALDILHLMNQRGIDADASIYASLLQGCVNGQSLAEGKLVHLHMIKTGFKPDVYLGTKLLIMNAKCGSLTDARQVFDKMPERNLVSWNAMIAAYAKQGYNDQALSFFYQMQVEGMKPNRFTFSSVVSACAGLAASEEGKQVHIDIVRNGFDSDLVLQNALIDMYVKCGLMDHALQVFEKMSERDVVSWTTMIVGYDKQGHSRKAVQLFEQMQQAGTKPNRFTFASLFRACAGLADLDRGKQVHGHVMRSGFESDVVLLNALIDMYVKCGSMEDARQVFDKMSQRNVVSWTTMVTGYVACGDIEVACKLFDEMPQRNVVSWTAMIAGYTESGLGEETLTLFYQMQWAGVKPDRSTFASILRACAGLAALEQGKQFHVDIIKSEFKSDIILHNALIDMYAKCGIMDDACRVFGEMSERNVVSWTTMIVAYGKHGHGKEALELFEQMLLADISPNDITFIGVLSACSHAGLVDEGQRYFDSMMRDHGITPRAEHYACIVDLLGRAGCLHEAHDFIKKMPVNPSAGVWGALLNACRVHCSLDLGKCAAEHLFDLEPHNAATYVMLSNMYTAASMKEDAAKVRLMMKDRGIRKERGCSWIDVRDTVHAFLQGDRSHHQIEEIYSMLDKLAGQMKEVGYVPNTNSTTLDVDEENKEHILNSHSEKLAIAFGLISTPPGALIRIIKNIRVCADCHIATKFISKITEREIVVRDANRFHHFKNGLCSCGDYW